MTEVIYDESKASSQSTVKTDDGKTVRANNVVVVGGAKPSAVEEMPVATLNNKGKIVQYVGETTAEYTQAYFYICTEYVAVDSSISISQYEGAGVTPSVDKDTFETQITASGTYDFSYDGEKWYLDGQEVDLADYGITYTESEEATATFEGTGITDASVVLATFKTQVESTGNYSFIYDGSDWKLDDAVVDLADYGISYTAVTASASASQTVGSDLGTVSVNVATFASQATTSGTYNFIYDGSDWKFGETVVDLTSYGISYTGASVPSSATISQTAGTGLTDVAVNVSTFESQISTAGSYVFTSDGTDWSYNGNVVDLTDYGITYTGTPVADDALTVVYTEAVVVPAVDDEIEVDYIAEGPYADDTITVAYEKGLEAGEVLRVEYVGYVYGYQWLQINVQPGGGAGSVDSVNGKTGVVVLDAEDVGALPDDTPIPDPQVNSDWNATSGVAEILNKPTIPSTAQQVGAIPQYETMPTASASNVGEIAQYSGETTPDVPASAVATQTVGSGLTDLAVDLETFVGVEQPSGAETVAFTANVIPSDMTFTSVPEGVTITVTDADAFVNWIRSTDHDPNDYTNALLHDNGAGFWSVAQDSSMAGLINGMDAADWANYGIVITGSPTGGDYDAYYELTIGETTWSKNGTTVDVADYGISYTGTPADGDTISVAYTPLVAGITNGYFYKSSVEYSDPTATISQTVGSGLSDLAVNVETFIETEQPTQDETVSFVADVTQSYISYSPDVVQDPNNYIFTLAEQVFGTASIVSYIEILSVDENRIATSALLYNTDGGFTNLGDLAENNIVISDVDVGQLVSAIYHQATTTWSKNGTTVDLAEYGISYSGTPVDGDTLTVAYTAPTPIGYSWEQVDVQPSSGGGNAGIEWKIKSDLEVGDYGYRCLAIPSGLPNGTYEYYIQIKRTPSEFGYRPLGYATYKVVMKIDNDNQQYRALVNPVLDGDYATTVFAQMRNYDDGQVIFISGSDMIFSLSTFRTNIIDYSPAETIVDCYKLSAVKNVDTNQEYVGTLSNTEPQSFDETRSITYCFGSVDELPYVPKYAGSGTLDFDNGDYVNVSDKYYGSNTVMLRIGFRYGFDEYEADMALYRNGHSIKVRKATGVFAQTEFVKDTDRRIFIKLNAPVGTTGAFNYVVGGVSEDSIGGMNTLTPAGTPTVLSTDMVGSIVDTNNIDIVSQYVGTTTASYTNGCFYKATGTVVTVPESAVCTETTSTGTTITCTNISGLVNKLASLTGWSTDYVKESFGWCNFQIPQDQTSIYYSGYGYWFGQDAADLIACFSFSPALSDSIDFTVQYVPETQEVQNGAWVLVDTQFTGITGYDATKTQVLKNVQGVLTWVDE